LTPLACRAIENYDAALPVEWTRVHHRLLAKRMLICSVLGRTLRYPQLVWAATAVLANSVAIAQPSDACREALLALVANDTDGTIVFSRKPRTISDILRETSEVGCPFPGDHRPRSAAEDLG
jgi:hypothetical protein